MNITMHRHDGHMDMLVRYASELFDEALIRRFLEQLSHTLSWMSDSPDATIAQVRLLPPSQAEMVRQFSRNAQRCIFDKRGGLVPVGVTGWVADTSGLLGSPAKWDEQGRLVRQNDDLHRVQANIGQETLPPAMPEKHPDSPVGRVQIEDSYSVFHANNCHDIHFANVLEAFDACGFRIDVVDDETFLNRFHSALDDKEKGIAVSSLVAYEGNRDETLQWMKWDNR